jgi:hypothetical protein
MTGLSMLFCNHFLMQSIEGIQSLFAISMEMMKRFSQNLTENKSVGDPWARKEIWIIIGQVGEFIIRWNTAWVRGGGRL